MAQRDGQTGHWKTGDYSVTIGIEASSMTIGVEALFPSS